MLNERQVCLLAVCIFIEHEWSPLQALAPMIESLLCDQLSMAAPPSWSVFPAYKNGEPSSMGYEQ